MTPVFIGPPKPPPVPPAPAWIGRNVIAAKLIADRGLDPAATIELLREESGAVRGALFFLSGAGMDIAAQRQKLTRWLRKFRVDDPDLAGTIAEALLLPGAALTRLRNYINEDHEGQPRSLWRHSRDRAVVDWATDLIGPPVGPHGGVTFAEGGAAATTILDWIEAADPFRPARTRWVVIGWLEDLERRAPRRRPAKPVRHADVGHAGSAGRAAPDAAVWAAAVEGIRRWWHHYPSALIGSPTGFGFVVLDIDVREDRDGFATLAQLIGSTALPVTLTAASRSGGRHLYFEAADPPIRNTAGKRGRGIGPGLDWRGLGGYIILPAPGTGYKWVALLPLAPVPEALLPKPAAAPLIIGTPASCSELSAYGEAALRSAAEKILSAPNGEQEATLNGESFSIGRLAGAGGVPAELALEILLIAGNGMPSHKAGDPWREDQVEEKVRRAFAKGMEVPRPAWIEVYQQLADAGDDDVTV